MNKKPKAVKPRPISAIKQPLLCAQAVESVARHGAVLCLLEVPALHKTAYFVGR